MKKIISILLFIAIVVTGIFFLTGCEKEKKEETENSNDNLEMHILSLDLGENEYIQVRVDYPKNSDIELKETEDDTSEIKIINEKKNYELKLALSDELEDTYKEGQEADKEENGYTEAKFAENDGYYYMFGKSTVMGNILIDTQTDNDFKYIYFELSPVKEGSDVLNVFKQTEVQNILSSFGFRYTTNSNENNNGKKESTGNLVGQWSYYTSYTYTFNADGTGTYDAMGTIMNFTYKDDGKQLSILYTGNTSPTVLDYKIDGNRLIITDSFGEDIVYVKK